LIVPDIIDLRRHIAVCERALERELLKHMRNAQQQLDHARETLRRCLAHKIDRYQRGLLHIASALQSRSPAREIVMRRNRFVDLRRRFVASPLRVIENAKQRFGRIEGVLRVLGPEATLRRGYSITTDEHGKIIRTVAAVYPRTKIRTRISDGEFGSDVTVVAPTTE
jgi:exodeoxyribonuclease VII large subunit